MSQAVRHEDYLLFLTLYLGDKLTDLLIQHTRSNVVRASSVKSNLFLNPTLDVELIERHSPLDAILRNTILVFVFEKYHMCILMACYLGTVRFKLHCFTFHSKSILVQNDSCLSKCHAA